MSFRAPALRGRVVDGGLAGDAAVNQQVVRECTAIVEKWCE
jgi:hypothetical protein